MAIPNTKISNVHDLWGFCLVGCFAGRFPGLKAIQNLVDSWKVKCSVLPHYSGWVIFQFENEQEMDRVLLEGPYFVFGRSLLLRSMPENFCFEDEDFSIVPVWIQLHNLPLQCWTNKAISRLASRVGNPICTDKITHERKRVSYARVLVEMNTATSPIEEFEVRLPSGTIYTQYIVYENLPKYCEWCCKFGHYSENCKYQSPEVDDKHEEETHKHFGDGLNLGAKILNVNPLEGGLNPDNTNSQEIVGHTAADKELVEGSNPVMENNEMKFNNQSVEEPNPILTNSESSSNQNAEKTTNSNPSDQLLSSDNSSPPSSSSAEWNTSLRQLVDGDGFQTVARRKIRGKAMVSGVDPCKNQQTVCSLPHQPVARSTYKSGFSKFIPTRIVARGSLDKSKAKDKGGGGVPQGSSSVQL